MKATEKEAEHVMTASPSDGSEFRVGGLIEGRYEIKESLGHGGFAHTWRAWTGTPRQTVSSSSSTQPSRPLLSESLPRRTASGTTCARESTTFVRNLILEYIPGVNFKEYASADLPDAERCRDIALDVLSALGHLHSRDLLHRDVTPSNVIVTPEGRAKLIDFGVASGPTARTVVGTPAFMAPEVRAGRGADARSDLYEFAVTMIYVMLGRFLMRRSRPR